MNTETTTTEQHDDSALYAGILNRLVRFGLAALCLSYLTYFFADGGVSPNSMAAAWSRSSSEYAHYIAAMNEGAFSFIGFLPDLCVMALALISPVCVIALAVHYKRRGDALHWKLAALLAAVFLFAASGLANML